MTETGRAAFPERLVLVTITALLLMLVPSWNAPADAAAVPSAETRMLELLNAERAAHGLEPLVEKLDIREVAYAWSEEMSVTGELAHNPSYSTQICCWRLLAENVARARGYDTWESATEAIHAALMESDDHRANMLHPDLTEVGIGVWYDGSVMWVTQDFRTPAVTPSAAAPGTSLATPQVRSIDLACPEAENGSTAFVDVAPGSPAAPAVTCVVEWGVTKGLDATSFGPDTPVSRAQMASFIATLIDTVGGDLPEVADAPYRDTDGSIHERSIARLEAVGIVSGCGDDSFCAGRSVTRAQMASFLAEAWRIVDGDELADGPRHFRDSRTSVHGQNIERIAHAGLAGGVADGTYAPGRPVTRAQMAMFLARFIDLAAEHGHTG